MHADSAVNRASCVSQAFARAMGHAPQGCWIAPGRVNLIGEHTDYNEGFVLPFALSHGAIVAASPRRDERLVASSLQGAGHGLASADCQASPGSVDGWVAYPAGVVWALRQAGYRVPGLNLIVDSDVPMGAGLSSSAALSCASALACSELFDLGLSRHELVGVARRAESEFVGVPVGPMDPTASLLCRAGHVLWLDTRTCQGEHIPVDFEAAGLRLVVIDTRTAHRLNSGEYAKRRLACAEAAEELSVPALRDVDLSSLEEGLTKLQNPILRRRTRHVVTENDRVRHVAGLLRHRDIRGIGPLLTASHESLRYDYEVSSTALNMAVDAALSAGALGARMIGGGFGGSAIALVPATHVSELDGSVREAFESRGLPSPRLFNATPSDAARRLLPAAKVAP